MRRKNKHIIRGILIGHGDFAKAMLKAAEKIVGKQRYVNVISNVGLSCDLLSKKINKIIHESRNEKIIFIDLPGGSCALSCLNIAKTTKNLNIICGANLPILIEFFLLREKYSAKELTPTLIKKGRENIIKLGEKNR